MILLNIQSVRNKGNELHILLEHNNFPQYVLLTEHWLKPDEPFELHNYVIASKFCRTQSLHGGTMILVHDSIYKKSELKTLDKFNYLLVEKEFEFSIIFDSRNNIYFICIYRPPSCDIMNFLIRLEDLLSKFSVNSHVIIAGDFNINYEEKMAASTQALENLFVSYNLKMMVQNPTRISEHSSTTIDYVCTNLDERNLTCNVISAGISDHEAVIFKFLACYSNKISFRFGRIYSKKNFEKFKQKCDLIPWEDVLFASDPMSAFHKLLTNVFEDCFPKRKIKRKNKKSWITKGIRISANNMRFLHTLRKYCSNPFFITYFNNYRKIYRQTIKCAKEIYYKERIKKAKNEVKENWAIVNNLRGNANSIPEQYMLNPNNLNDFYCTIAEKLTSTIGTQDNPMNYLKGINIPNTFLIEEINLFELKEVVQDIKNKNSSGIDEISPKILCNLPDTALHVLVNIINGYFAMGEFPSCLKTALVIPLFKGGELDDPSNFRPISLLSTLSKIIEKLMKKRVLEFMTDNKILSYSQFGFQSSKSTNDAIFSFLENVYINLNNAESVAAVFCDFSKAFDCVNHLLLLEKLYHYGFKGISFKWFKSYISDRKQIVRSNGKLSQSKDILWGVPQGSVLGPILFLIYINDLASIQIQGKFTIFADDTTLAWHGKDTEELEGIIGRDLEKVKRWCDSNYLCLNLKKTNVLTFGFHCEVLSLNGYILENKGHSKFLGISIDNKLKFDHHVIALRKKISSGCYALRVASNELSFSTTKMVYHSLIESHLRYGIAFWGFCSQQLFLSVFVLQKRAVRYLCGARVRESCRPLFVGKRILTLISIFILESVCLIYKKYSTTSQQHTAHYVTRQITDGKLALPIPKSALMKDSIIYESKKMFNHIPTAIRNAESYEKFRKKVSEALLLKAYYNLEEFYDDTLL